MDGKITPLSQDAGSLGTFAHYNGLILGDIIAEQADCEGALAVGGTAKFGSAGYGYDIGAGGVSGWESILIGKYQNPNGYPSFLLGGTISAESTRASVYTGDAAFKKSYQKSYEDSSFNLETNAVHYFKDSLIDEFFISAEDQTRQLGNALLNGTEKKIELKDLQSLRTLNHSQYLSEHLCTDKKILVFTIDCEPDSNISIGEIDFGSFVTNYDAVIINAAAKKVSFTSGAILYDGAIIDTSLPGIYDGNKYNAALAKKVVFNFPNAEDIILSNYGAIGAMIAPNANVNGQGGSINGMLVARSLHQRGGMELHAFTNALGDELWELGCEIPLGSITVRKQNPTGQIWLEGASFTLFIYNEETDRYEIVSAGKTNDTGELVFEDLIIGQYKLEETKAPRGYVMPDNHDWTFKIELNEKGDIIELNTFYIKNTLAAGSAKFLKLDYNNNEIKLADAVFSLYKLNEETQKYDLLQSGLITNAEGILEVDDLAVGEYRLVETQAPDGYYLPDDYAFEFTIELNEEGEIEEFETITILNQLLGSVQILKVDAEDAKITLEGAVFSLYRLNTETDDYELVSANLTTDENGQLTISGLEPGEYKLTETAAPSGYYLAPNADTLFTIETDADDRLIPLAPINVSNKLLGKVQIYKVDSENDEIFLEGAVFTLYKLDEESSEYKVLRTDLVTDSNGGLLIEGLEPGDYKLVETKSPFGYVLPENPETTFTVTL